MQGVAALLYTVGVKKKRHVRQKLDARTRRIGREERRVRPGLWQQHPADVPTWIAKFHSFSAPSSTVDVADDGGPASYRPVAGLLPVARAEEAPGNFSNCKCSVFTAKEWIKSARWEMAMLSWPRWRPRSPTQRMRSPVRGEGGAVNKFSRSRSSRRKITVSMNGSVMRQRESARMVLMSSTESEKLQPSEKISTSGFATTSSDCDTCHLQTTPKKHGNSTSRAGQSQHWWNRVPVAWKQRRFVRRCQAHVV